MGTLIDSLRLLSTQLALGATLLVLLAPLFARSTRRRRATWARAGRSMLRIAPAGLVAALLLSPLGEPATDPVLIVVGSLATAGGALLYSAAALERRGRLRAARRQVRLGGHTAAIGLAVLLPWLALPAALAGTFHPTRGIALAALGAAALVALLSGLSAKPRPSCHAAALLYLSGLIVLVGSA